MLTAVKFKRVFFEKEALDYPLGKEIYQKLRKEGFNINFLGSHNRLTGIPGRNPREAFFQGKSTLVVGIRKNLKFETCKPSAHFQLPLVTGCEGICEYCYLNTQLGKKPYTRIYVNIDEILNEAKKYIEKRKPEITVFEAAATSDPVAVEPYSGALSYAIKFFAGEEYGRLRFVTKFPYVDKFLSLTHNRHTRIRFSLNTERIIKTYEHRTPNLEERLSGLKKIIKHDYPSGVIIAPVILDEDWKNEYEGLLHTMHNYLQDIKLDDFHLEIISHRFTTRAKNNILEVFPHTLLPMEENHERKFKYGQFGYGKFVYNDDKLREMKSFFTEKISHLFPSAVIDYII